jgi:hypothetical protein
MSDNPLDERPIQAAKTIKQFVVAANEEFGFHLPVEWPGEGVTTKIWALKITVITEADPTNYIATATTAYPNMGAETSAFSGVVNAAATQDGRSQLPYIPIAGALTNDILRGNR